MKAVLMLKLTERQNCRKDILWDSPINISEEPFFRISLDRWFRKKNTKQWFIFIHYFFRVFLEISIFFLFAKTQYIYFDVLIVFSRNFNLWHISFIFHSDVQFSKTICLPVKKSFSTHWNIYYCYLFGRFHFTSSCKTPVYFLVWLSLSG